MNLLRTEPFDAVLLDVNMPGIGGIETLRRMRTFAPRLPVLMLTVRDREEEKVNALELGADDYVTKPFGVRELVARIRAAVRRVHAPAPPEEAPIEIGEIRLVPARRSVTRRGQAIHLTRKEFDILHCLMSRAGRVVTYARLLTAVWGARLPRRSRIPAHLRPPASQEDRGRSRASQVPAHRHLCRLSIRRCADARRSAQCSMRPITAHSSTAPNRAIGRTWASDSLQSARLSPQIALDRVRSRGCVTSVIAQLISPRAATHEPAESCETTWPHWFRTFAVTAVRSP